MPVCVYTVFAIDFGNDRKLLLLFVANENMCLLVNNIVFRQTNHIDEKNNLKIDAIVICFAIFIKNKKLLIFI